MKAIPSSLVMRSMAFIISTIEYQNASNLRLVNKFSIGMRIDIEGPNGHCFYSDATEHPILMVVTGTGLAPLLGIVRDVLHQGHCGAIHLYHGARSSEELCLHDILLDMAQKHANFHYHGCVNNEVNTEGITSGHAAYIALAEHPALKGWKVFLCGAPEMVEKISKLVFLSGANMKDISSDAFTYSSA